MCEKNMKIIRILRWFTEYKEGKNLNKVKVKGKGRPLILLLRVKAPPLLNRYLVLTRLILQLTTL